MLVSSLRQLESATRFAYGEIDARAYLEKFYHLRIDQTGAFLFIIFTGHTSSSVLAEGTTSAFHQGAGQPNVLAVVAQGDRFTLYVNHQQIKSLTNGTYSQGQIGLVATDTNSPAEVVFTNARVWSY